MRKTKGRIAAMVLAAAALGVGTLTGTAVAPAEAAATPTWSQASYYNITVTVYGDVGLHIPAASNGSLTCVMDYDAQSAAVGVLQNAANTSRYNRGLTVDENYGPATQAAVRYIQSYEGVANVDGSFGPITRYAMRWPIQSPAIHKGKLAYHVH
ncbi:MAG: peptidoglycan-binding protein [Bifidobacteriaceae bacterium]|jgi:peptidoglycan hydrolase-like protein with peptidoglycan-binding domain|nr:peptidoglycan-binding protein [Bifidobacteriaceae bacterium]